MASERTLPPARVGPLKTLCDVRSELRRLYRAGRRGDIPSQDASRLASILGLLLRSIEDHEIERRVAALEHEEG